LIIKLQKPFNPAPGQGRGRYYFGQNTPATRATVENCSNP